MFFHMQMFGCANLHVLGEVSFHKGLVPDLSQQPKHTSPRVTSFNIIHHLEEQLLCLELSMLVAPAFDVALCRFACSAKRTALATSFPKSLFVDHQTCGVATVAMQIVSFDPSGACSISSIPSQILSLCCK